MSTIASIIKRQPKSDRVSKSSVGYLWASEDALANWIGFILIAIAAIGVITGFYDFSAGSYYYADIPGFEKWFNSTPFASTVSSALIFLLFLVWGTLMMKLWLWIDRKVSNDGSGET